ELAGQRREARDRGAVHRLGPPDLLLVRPEVVRVLGGDDQGGAELRGAADLGLGGGDAGLGVGRGGELDGGGEEHGGLLQAAARVRAMTPSMRSSATAPTTTPNHSVARRTSRAAAIAAPLPRPGTR